MLTVEEFSAVDLVDDFLVMLSAVSLCVDHAFRLGKPGGSGE